MSILTSFFNILLISLLELAYLFGVIILVGLILGVLERYSNSFLYRAFGAKGVLATAWIGVPIHEIGHLLQCFLWGHKVTQVKLLQLNSADGTLGFVRHQYNPNSMYQQAGNFFIGLGPIFSGVGSLLLGMYLLVPQSFATLDFFIAQHITFEKVDLPLLLTVWEVVVIFSKNLFTLENLLNPLFWVYFVLAICISSHIALSWADIKGSARGLGMIFFLLVLWNLTARIFGFVTYRAVTKLAEYNAYVLAFSSIALTFSLLTWVISYLLYQVKIRLANR